MAGQMKSSNPKVVVVTKPTGNKIPNKPASVVKKAAVKYAGPKSTVPTAAVPSKMKMGGMKKPTMKMGGMKSKKGC